MESIIHADIFFFVTTIVLIVISSAILIALVYVIKILRNVSEVSDHVKHESDEIIADIKELRGSIREQGLKGSSVFSFIRKIGTHLWKRKTHNTRRGK